MATIAEQLLAGYSKVASHETENPGSGLAVGAQIAAHKAQVEQQRAQLELQKQQHEMQKIEKIGSWYETADKMPDGAAKKAFIKNFIPDGINALGMGEKIHPVTQEMLAGEPGMVPYLKEKIRTGAIKYGDVQEALVNPEKMAELMKGTELEKYGGQEAIKSAVDDYGGTLDKTAQFAASEEGKALRAKEMAQAQLGKQVQGQTAAPEVEYKKKVGDIMANFNANGGSASVKKNISAFDTAIAQLRSNKVQLGTLAKNLPYGANMDVLARIDPAAKALIDQVQGGVNMRAALADPNPTEKQISMILNRTIDPRLSNEENIKKLEAMKTELQEAAESRQAEARKYGFSAAKSASAPSFSVSDEQKAAYAKLPKDQQMQALQGLAAKLNVPLAKIKKALGVK